MDDREFVSGVVRTFRRAVERAARADVVAANDPSWRNFRAAVQADAEAEEAEAALVRYFARGLL